MQVEAEIEKSNKNGMQRRDLLNEALGDEELIDEEALYSNVVREN